MPGTSQSRTASLMSLYQCINIIRHDICSSPTQNTEGGYLLTGRRSDLPKVPKLIKEKNIFEKVILSEDETSKEEEK